MSKTMIPTNDSIIVVRDGKQFAPPAGKPFEFTDEELADIKRLSPKAVREPVNEAADDDDDGDDEAEVASPLAAVAQPVDADEPEPAKKSAKKAPAKDDDEL